MVKQEWNKGRQDEDVPTWMTTYSDMVTLLLTFFVMLFSFSVINVQKFQHFLASFQGVGILEAGLNVLNEPQSIRNLHEESEPTFVEPVDLAQAREMMETYQSVLNFLAENGLEDMVEVRYEDGSVALDIKERILFDSGKADLKPEAMVVLDKLASLLGSLPNNIRVEGHTDNRPINTPEFPSNWELSSARAARVVRYLIDKHKLEPARFTAVGHGEYRPLVPNDSPEHMAQNRRVVILLEPRGHGTR